ncbi:MAG TPA: hemerythrin [Nitrospiraceae bacterium]|nr:hemerythrin [Nitrospiraceae bacterium]
MEWTQDLAVGVADIDEQHRELFRRINNLLVAIKEQRCKEEVDSTIAFLEDYARTHFGDEERNMESAGYADLAEHRKRHATYLANLAEIKREASAPRVRGVSYELSVDTNKMVVDWIVDHIMKVDKQFGSFVKGRQS